MIKTKYRLSTILLFCFLCWVIIAQLIDLITDDEPMYFSYTFIEAISLVLLAFLAFGFLLYNINYIQFDELNREITFYYPFRIKKGKYRFEDIEGFRFIYILGEMDFKSIEIKTTNGKKYKISDFTTKNFNVFKSKFLEHFELKGGKDFKKLTEKGKNRALKQYTRFRKKQLQQLRNMMYGIIIISVLLIFSIIFASESFNPKIIPTVSFCIFIIVVASFRILKLNKIIARRL